MAGSGRTTTYAELDDRSLRLAHLLADAGLEQGDVSRRHKKLEQHRPDLQMDSVLVNPLELACEC